MSFLQQLALGVAIPAVVAVIVAAVGAWRGARWTGGLSVALGYVAGHFFIRGVPRQLPVEVEDWLPILASVALAAGLVDLFLTVPRPLRCLTKVAVAAAAVYLLARPMIANVWPRVEAAAWIAGLVLGIVAVWSILDRTVSRSPGPVAPFVLGLTMAGMAIVQGLSSSLVLARLAGAAAIAIAPLAFVAWRRPGDGPVRGALPVMIVLFAGLMMAGVFYSEVPRGSALILALTPLSVVLSRIGKRPWIGALLAVGVAFAGVGVSLGIAVATATPESSASEY